MADSDAGIISIYYGEDVKEEDADALREFAETEFPDADVTVYRGGQPIYYYIVSVE